MSATFEKPPLHLAPTDPPELRFRRYQSAIDRQFSEGDTGLASYYLANLALEKLVASTATGEEPPMDSLSRVANQLDLAAEINSDQDRLTSLRARLLKAWMRPIVWSSVLNHSGPGFNDREARNAAEFIGLAESADVTAELLMTALKEYDDVRSSTNMTEDQIERMHQISGFINEATLPLLGARHTTAKQFALPSLAYDDRINPNISLHIDGFYYDNRRARGAIRRFPYQVEGSVSTHEHIHPSIPIINSRDMGNMKKSSRWPRDDRPFATAHHLVMERQEKGLTLEYVAPLDRITSFVLNKITRHPTK